MSDESPKSEGLLSSQRWHRKMIERVSAGCYSLIQLFIEKMVPWPLVFLIVVSMLVGSGVAWKIVIKDWIDIQSGSEGAANEQMEDTAKSEEAAPGAGMEMGVEFELGSAPEPDVLVVEPVAEPAVEAPRD